MALFEQKRDMLSGSPLYSIGSNRTVLIIGLGNPGKEYDGTRHNVGFAVVDEFAKKNDFPGWVTKKDLKCHLTIHTQGDTRVILCKPTTFMNDSGQAAGAVQKFYRVYNAQTLAVYDELAVEFGNLRIRLGGSDAGHNGVKSLINHLGDDFGRLRIGIGSEISQKTDASDFVLGRFNKKEQETLPLIKNEATTLITKYILNGNLSHKTRSVL